MELEECIKDALDDSLQNYTHSVEYIQEKQEINEKLQSFRTGLSDIQKQQFNEIIDAITCSDGMLASEAYMTMRHGTLMPPMAEKMYWPV